MRLRLVAITAMLLAPHVARADDPPPPPATRLVANNLLAARVNPLGLEDQLRIGVQQTLYPSANAILRDNFFFGGIYPKINPAFGKIGPSIEIQPVSIFNLRVAAEVVGFFSSFGFLQSFPSPLADFSDTQIKANRDAKQNYASYGAHFMIEPTIQFKLGPIVVRDKVAIEYWRMKVRDGDTVFYEPTLDTAVPRDGWIITSDLDVLFLHELSSWKGRFQGARLIAGVRYSAVKPLYKNSDFKPGEDRRREDNDHHRLGPLLGWSFFDNGYSSFTRPTLIAIVNWYVDHRFRTGRDVSAAVPYFVLAFAFQSDLLPR